MKPAGDQQSDLDLPLGVRPALRAGADQADHSHVDPVELAEFLDGVLAKDARQLVEAHLAICATCRRVATAVAGMTVAGMAADAAETSSLAGLGSESEADRVVTRIPVPMRPRKPTRWLAAAAVLFAVLGVALLRTRGPHGSAMLSSLGVGPEVLAAADPALVRIAVRAAAGEWPGADALDEFSTPGGGSVLRAGEVTAGPEPVVPRWSAVDDTRPVLRWRWTGAQAPERYEVLVVDQQEKPVAFLEADPNGVYDQGAHDQDAYSGRWQATIAESVPGLERGEIYAWKVNVQEAGEWLASAYVPFRVLSESESAQLARDLEATGGVAFLQAVVFASHGLDARALDALAATPASDRAREALARALLDRKRLSASAIEAEIEGLDSP